MMYTIGRKEMYIMFGFLFLATIMQIILATGVAGNAKGGKVRNWPFYSLL
jgi:hypothetical protein